MEPPASGHRLRLGVPFCLCGWDDVVPNESRSSILLGLLPTGWKRGMDFRNQLYSDYRLCFSAFDPSVAQDFWPCARTDQICLSRRGDLLCGRIHKLSPAIRTFDLSNWELDEFHLFACCSLCDR